MKAIKLISILIISMFMISCGDKKKPRTTLAKGAFNVYLGKWRGETRYYDKDFKLIETIKKTEIIIKTGENKYESKGTLIYDNEAEHKFTTKYKIENGLIMKLMREETEMSKMLGSMRSGAFVWMASQGDDFTVINEKVTHKLRVANGYDIKKGKARFIKFRLEKM